MPNTTPVLESINAEALLFVSGGCGGCHRHRCCGQQQQQCIINMPPAPAGPVLPQLAQGQPQPDPGLGGYPSTMVSTNVSINGQPIAGQGQPTATA